MGRILRKKTESQKSKLKMRQDKSDLNQGSSASSEVNDAPVPKETVKRIVPPKKVEEQKKSTQNQEPGYYQKLSQFLREVKAEMKKVVWPPKNQAVTSTVVVIILVIIVSSLLGLFDLILNSLIQMVLK